MLETYAALFSAAADVEEPTACSAVLSGAQSALEEQLLLGEARYPESLCPTTLGNALLLLVQDGGLACDGNPRLPDTKVEPGPHRVALETLQARVARGLETR